MNKRQLAVLGLVLLPVLFLAGLLVCSSAIKKAEEKDNGVVVPESLTTPSASPSASPTPRPLTFKEMESLFGPCTTLPVLMYHHVESAETALEKKRVSLNVTPENFREQVLYLQSKGYAFVTPDDLTEFFDAGKLLPKKAVMLTFDDGYVDNYLNAFPILKEMKVPAVIYLATGLMDNPDYMSWIQVKEMAESGLVEFGNHTWSHKNVGANQKVVAEEILWADKQLVEKNLNKTKTFAYPYGIENKFAAKYLGELGYKLAFDTSYGKVLCKQKRFYLPRIRVGNTTLKNYGL